MRCGDDQYADCRVFKHEAGLRQRFDPLHLEITGQSIPDHLTILGVAADQ
jgi:hypothetical protein